MWVEVCLSGAFIAVWSMRKIVQVSLVLSIWLISTGAHWDVIQVFAWVNMFSSNIGEISYREAVVRTFDPAEKCEVCAVVEKAKQEEQSNSILAGQFKEKQPLIVLSVKLIIASDPELDFSRTPDCYRNWIGMIYRAAVPPPRVG